MPAAFSSQVRKRPPGRLYASEDYVVVFEAEPFCVAEMMLHLSGRSSEPAMIQYTYAATVFYRKSRNPHGPSSRPIYVACLEHSAVCRYEEPSFWGRLTGAKRRPLEVFVGIFYEGGRSNLGVVPNDFTEESAARLLLEHASRCVGLRPDDFRQQPGFEQGLSCPAIA